MSPDTPEPLPPSIDTDRIKAQLRRWQERLLDLTKGNPLLGINRSRVTKLRVIEPSAQALFDQFVVGDVALEMPMVRKERQNPGEEPSEKSPEAESAYLIEDGDIEFDARPSELARKLRRVYDNARTTVEERGLTTLHLTFGLLKWNDPLLGESVAPLLMIPCELNSPGSSAPLRLTRADEDLQVNPALELYLREREGVLLPPLAEESKEGDLTEFLDGVGAAVRDRGWSVESEVWLSTFTFEALAIYQDLRAMASMAIEHRIIVALSRASTQRESSEALPDEPLDEPIVSGSIPIPVLPTDSSQLEALVDARAGRNLVIHGPPGTGKSQTIANLIADALGRNKTVLFVSAKMAALNVVFERLAQLGLGRFCLEAHSTKAGKAKIVEELKRTLESPTAAENGELAEQLADSTRIRNQLNEYVRDLHVRREPFGRSVYQVIGRSERLRDTPDVRAPLPWKDSLAVSRNELATALDLLRDLAAQAGVFDRKGSHPWRGCIFASTPGNLLRQEDFETLLITFRNSNQELGMPLASISKLLGPGLVAASLDQLNELVSVLTAVADVSQLPEAWALLPIEELTSRADRLRIAAANAEEFASKNAQFDLNVGVPFGEARSLLGPVSEEFSGRARILRPRYWHWLFSVRRQLRPGAPSDMNSIRSYLALATRLIELDAWFTAHRDALSTEVSADNIRDAVTLLSAGEALTVAARLRGRLQATSLATAPSSPLLTIEIREAMKTLVARLEDARWKDTLAQIDGAWPGGFVEAASARASALPRTSARCEELLAALPEFHEWFVLQHTLRRCSEAGLDEFVRGLEATGAVHAAAAFERRFCGTWVSAAMQQDASLAVFAGVRRDEQIQRFRSLDESIRRSSLEMIKAAAAAPAQRIATAQSDPRHVSEVATLRRELEKRRRIKPLRRLFAEIPHALQALKPCMLMSPISVSTFLRPDAFSFDLVIFDEASQLPTPEAVPSIIRAKQVVVAGDANQLPPTSFFASSIIVDEERDTEDSDEDLEPLESLLDDCVAIVPAFERTHLKWHYRSRDERLIMFSNHYFYDNMLTTFPQRPPQARSVA